MKLILCPQCQDVFKLQSETKSCKCGLVSGKYKDDLYAEISAKAIPIGFHNPSLGKAIKNQPISGNGYDFTAFVIPKNCPTIEVLWD